MKNFTINGNYQRNLYVERQGWQKQHCSRNAACVGNTHEQDAAAPPHTHAAEVCGPGMSL